MINLSRNIPIHDGSASSISRAVGARFAVCAVILLGAAAVAPVARAADAASLKPAVCGGNATTSVSGTVYAPNGVDPLPDVLVYIPGAPLAPFPDAVSCGQEEALVSGEPLTKTHTAADGTFTLTGVPAGKEIPLVIQAGRWRRLVTVPAVEACADTAFSTRLPRNQSEGDIPRIALVTGAADALECVLRKTGIDDAEFTNPAGSGRIHLFTGDNGGNDPAAAGARIDSGTRRESELLGNAGKLNAYDMIMLPCQGVESIHAPGDRANLFDFANAGGRIFASHLSASWLGETTAPTEAVPASERASDGGGTEPTVDTTQLAPLAPQPFNTPTSAAPAAQCGRVLLDAYHAENADAHPAGTFPTECHPGPMTAAEKELEYALFDLTNFVKPAPAPAAVKPAISPTAATVTLTAASTKWNYPGSTNLDVCVSIHDGAYPLGTVQILDGATVLTTLAFHGGVNCLDWYIPTYLDAGFHHIRAVYTDAHNHTSSPSIVIEINRGFVEMEVSCWNYQFNYGPDYQCDFNMDAGTTKGYITYSYDGGPPVAVTLNSWGGAILIIHRPNVGYHGVTIKFPQQGNWNAFALPTQNFWVDPSPMQVSITPSSYYAPVGTHFSFAVAVTSSSAPPPDHVGTVYFTDGPTLIATLPVDATGHVTFHAGALGVGTHVITANYIGAGNYANGYANATIVVAK